MAALMSTDHTITVKAQRDDGRDGGELTMAGLRQFLEEFDKATADTPGPAADATEALKPKARVSFGGHVKSLTVTVPGDTPAT
jgi:hypothetical protein